MAGSFNSMRGGGSSSVGGGRLGNGVSKFGRGNGGVSRQSVNNSVGGAGGDVAGQEKLSGGADRKYKSPWSSTNKSPWSGWGKTLQEAAFGRPKTKDENRPLEKNVKSKQKLPQGILDMQIKVDPSVKSGDVKYKYRKNMLSISGEEGIDRKKLPKKIIEMAEDSQRFRTTTGIGKISREDRRTLSRSLRKKRLRVKRVNRQLLSSATKRSRAKSASRKITFGDLVK